MRPSKLAAAVAAVAATRLRAKAVAVEPPEARYRFTLRQSGSTQVVKYLQTAETVQPELPRTVAAAAVGVVARSG